MNQKHGENAKQEKIWRKEKKKIIQYSVEKGNGMTLKKKKKKFFQAS